MNLYQLIRMYGFDPLEFKFVRHGYKEINPLLLFREDPEKFVSYQSFMRATGSKNYDGRKYAAVFAPHHGTQALFLGVWQVFEKAPAFQAPKKRLRDVEKFGWNLKSSAYYKLKG